MCGLFHNLFMIKTVADVIGSIIKREKVKLDEFGPINHGPTIGDMYEGLTQHCLKLAIPKGINLKVVTGFIRNKDHQTSKQIDCMLVLGDGEQIPHTDSFIYPIEQVLVTVEVKKSLSQTGLGEAFDNLASFARFVPDFDIPFRFVQSAFQLITRKTLSSPNDINQYSVQDQMIYYGLVNECTRPVSVVLAYDGYKTEKTFRNAVKKFIFDSEKSNRKISITLFPTLIINGDHSLIKLNGYPFASYNSDKWWDAIASYHTNSAKILIEIIWSKLNMITELNPNVFGEDMDLEELKPFIRAQARSKTIYDLDIVDLSKNHLKRTSDTIRWSPVEITHAEYIFLNILLQQPDLSIADKDFQEFLKGESLKQDKFIQSLRRKGLVYFNGRNFEYFAVELAVIILPNGKSYAGSNVDNRFSHWVVSQILGTN